MGNIPQLAQPRPVDSYKTRRQLYFFYGFFLRELTQKDAFLDLFVNREAPVSKVEFGGHHGHRAGGPRLTAQIPADPELLQDLLLQLNPYKSLASDGIHPRTIKEALISLQSLS